MQAFITFAMIIGMVITIGVHEQRLEDKEQARIHLILKNAR